MQPTFSFIIPVFNAQMHIRTCLASIRAQDYPQDKVEVILLDGGCTDSTIDTARQFEPKVFPNPKKLAEYGLQVGIKHAHGDLVVIFAADNELHSKDWLTKAARPFSEDHECSAVWGPLKSGLNDPPINKYFELIQSDPMTFFMNKNISSYLNDAATRIRGSAFIFKVDPHKPLVWGANGLVLKRELISPIWAQHGYLGDNDAFQQMIEQGNNKVAYIMDLITYHHHVGKVNDWVGKWKRNFSQHFLDKLDTRNTNWVFVDNFRARLILWLIYSTNPILSGSHAVYLSIRDRNIFWFYHPLLCFLQTFVYTYIILATPKGRDTMLRIAKGAV
ncbi:MAG: glycosyltransferase family 2 protein [Deltaproteobacteria bacterium]|nr:glycosyltransferase family 2 protein [Deltaproteobacteria bacterium]